MTFTHCIYRPGKDHTSESVLQQLTHTAAALARSEQETQELSHQLIKEKNSARQRHLHLIEDLSKALQARETAVLAVKSLETIIQDKNAPDSHVYELVKSNLRNIDATSAALFSSPMKTKAIHNLVQELVETDHGLYEAERRATRLREAKRATSTGNAIARERREREQLTEKIRRDRETLESFRGTRVTLIHIPYLMHIYLILLPTCHNSIWC